MREGIVLESSSECASPIVVVRKKKMVRLCVDYRRLNEKIYKDRYPLPLIGDQLDHPQGSKLFSILDLKHGFFHVPLHENSRKYTAFVVPDGHYEFLKTPGLCNSPALFQGSLTRVFRDLIRDGTVLTYLDDLIVPSCNEGDGVRKLRKVLSTASEYGLRINWKKCRFLQRRIEYLGHVIEGGNERPPKCKTLEVTNFPPLRNTRDVQSFFLDLTSYFWTFVPQYSLLAHPLSKLLKKNAKFEFGKDQQLLTAFRQLKLVLACDPVLVKIMPYMRKNGASHGCKCRPWIAIFLQKDDVDQLFYPIHYASWKTTEAESQYTNYELEVLLSKQ